MGAQVTVRCGQLGAQALQLPVEHGRFFGGALGAAAEEESFDALGGGNQFDFQPFAHPLPVRLVQQRGRVGFALAPGSPPSTAPSLGGS
jgi:hypothetical protein